MKIAVFGIGYVGCTSLVCLAEIGHEALGIDINPDKVKLINDGVSPILEPGVDELTAKHRRAGRLRATTDSQEAMAWADAALICVGTPSTPHGAIDTGYLERVVADIAEGRVRTGRIVPILVRSTALPATHQQLIRLVGDRLGESQPAAYCVHPEFLREGQALQDFMAPPKIIFGCTDNAAKEVCGKLYPGIPVPATHTDPMTAAMVKYADNCFHAVKVTFANEIGMLAKAQNVDARRVMELFCMDTKLNISAAYLRPGLPFGGSCLPKDLRAVVAWSRQNMVNLPMIETVISSNTLQIERITGRIIESGARAVGMFGLAFKDNTDDLRESPLVTMAEILTGKGIKLRIHDPALSIKRIVGTNRLYALSALPHLEELMSDDPAEIVQHGDTVVIARAFQHVDWSRMPWRPEQRVLDLVSMKSWQGTARKPEGLYW